MEFKSLKNIESSFRQLRLFGMIFSRCFSANEYELHTDHTVTTVQAARKIIPNSRSCRNDDSMFFNDLNSISL